jgi:putative tryptophan/tyrosine transport system substrate-binding protein
MLHSRHHAQRGASLGLSASLAAAESPPVRAGRGAVGLALVAGCGLLPSQAQRPARVARLGILSNSSAHTAFTAAQHEAFREGLRALGYEEGQNLEFEFRYAERELERLPALAAELVRLPVDLLVAGNDPAIQAAKRASETIPIVFPNSSAPVETGFVASYARPGGNATGLTDISPELSGKRLQVLRDALPGLAQVAVLWSPQFAGPALQFQETESAARALGLDLLPFPVHGAEEIDAAFEAAGRGRAEALVVLPDVITITHARRIAEQAARNRLPAMYGHPAFMDAGCLMSYGTNFADNWRRAAAYVDKVLKGVKPADLPVERPWKFDFIINLQTAQALGLTIPPHVLAQATEVIQ